MSVEEEIRACLKKLEVQLSEIGELRELIGDKQQLFGAKKNCAQEKLKIFKKNCTMSTGAYPPAAAKPV